MMDDQYDFSLLKAWYNITRNNSELLNSSEIPETNTGELSAAAEEQWRAVSENIRSRIHEIDTAKKSLSFVRSMESALAEMEDKLTRMLELATLASDDTRNDDVDRKALDREFQQLKHEIDRIAESVDMDWNHL